MLPKTYSCEECGKLFVQRNDLTLQSTVDTNSNTFYTQVRGTILIRIIKQNANKFMLAGEKNHKFTTHTVILAIILIFKFTSREEKTLEFYKLYDVMVMAY